MKTIKNKELKINKELRNYIDELLEKKMSENPTTPTIDILDNMVKDLRKIADILEI